MTTDASALSSDATASAAPRRRHNSCHLLPGPGGPPPAQRTDAGGYALCLKKGWLAPKTFFKIANVAQHARHHCASILHLTSSVQKLGVAIETGLSGQAEVESRIIESSSNREHSHSLTDGYTRVRRSV